MNEVAPGAAGGWFGSGQRAWALGAVVVAGALQLIVLVPFTVASGLVAPMWAIVGLYALWLLGAVVLVRLARTQPYATLAVPLVNAALLWLAITAGEQWLGWVA